MKIEQLRNAHKNCPQGVPLLGLDVGKKTLGVAVSDARQGLSVPVKTIFRTKFSKDLIEIKALIKDYEIGGFIVGYPLNMDGSEGVACQSIRDFAAELALQLSQGDGGGDYPVFLWDERLSTASVEDFVDKIVGKSRRKAKESGIIDKLAAQVILQGALDYLQAQRNIIA